MRNIRFHDLRHTCASLLLAAGAPLVAVQKVLRHRDPKITFDVYSHFEDDYLRREVDKLSFEAPDVAATEADCDEGAAYVGAPFAAGDESPA